MKRIKKKGMVFSISMLIIGGLILAFAILIYNQSANSELQANEINLVNRAYDLSSSVGQGIKTIFTNTQPIKIQIENTNNNYSIIISESIPNTNMTDFITQINQFKGFIENDTETIKINTNSIEEFPILISPYSITYQKSEINNSNIEILNPTSQSNYKNIEFTLTVQNPSSFNWASSGGTIPVKITLKNSTKTITDTKNWNFIEYIEISTLNSQGNEDFKLELRSEKITIKPKNGATAIETKLTFTNQTSISAYYPGSIYINLTEFDLTQYSNIRLL